MSKHIENLYSQIIINNSNIYTNLRVISGYSSANFLRKVSLNFPQLQIELFIGMSLEGISINNHKLYNEIQKKNKNIKVYYQIEMPNNHMKIIEFFDGNFKKSYVGSANFSENGFFHQQEIMIESELNFDWIFSNQKKISKLTTDTNIERYINFYEDEILKSEIVNDLDTSFKNLTSEKRKDNHTRTLKMQSLRRKINTDFYKKFSISTVLPKEFNWKWDKSGINNRFDNGIPELEETPKISFELVFPTLKKFKIYTATGNIITAELSGRENKRKIKFENFDLYQYIADYIGLNEIRPISYEDLIKKECLLLHFTRINELEYIMSLEEISY